MTILDDQEFSGSKEKIRKALNTSCKKWRVAWRNQLLVDGDIDGPLQEPLGVEQWSSHMDVKIRGGDVLHLIGDL